MILNSLFRSDKTSSLHHSARSFDRFCLVLILAIWGGLQNANAQQPFCEVDHSGYIPLTGFEGSGGPGPYYVKLYIHLIKNGNDEYISLSEVEDLKQILYEQYAPQNIYFAYPCVDYVPLFYQNPSAALQSAYVKSDGLNLFLLDQNGGEAPAGLAYFGSNTCWAKYPYVYGPVTDKAVAVHEIGHCLTLEHTHYTGNGVENVERNPMGACYNCENEGDRCCDTPADPYEVPFLIPNCVWTNPENKIDLCAVPYSIVDISNTMSYYIGCRTHFSSCQGGYMRDHIGTHPEWQTSFPTVITSNTVWSSPISSDYDILITKPYSLTLSSTTLEMAPSRKITVEPGAHLILNSSEIRASHAAGCIQTYGLWRGVYLLPGNLHHGDKPAKLTADNSTIREAEEAIYYNISYNPNAVQGIVRATNSHFVNNRLAINFFAYTPPTDRNPNLFTGCEFTLDDGFELSSDRQINLVVSRKTIFEGCSFTDERADGVCKYGIYSMETPLTVQLSCPPGWFCISPLFSGFDERSIKAQKHTALSRLKVQNTRFYNSPVMIEGSSLRNFDISSNAFYVDGAGAALSDIDMYGIRKNLFYRAEGTDFAKGLDLSSFSNNSNFVFNNDFHSMDRCISAFSSGPSIPDPLAGLAIQCNTQEITELPSGSIVDYYTPGRVAPTQGTSTTSAGNEFSYFPPNGDFSDFSNPYIDEVTYYYKENGFHEKPLDFLNLTRLEAGNGNEACSPNYAPWGLRPLSEIEGLYIYWHTRHDSLRADYNARMDGGNKSGLIGVLNSATAANKSSVRATLLGLSPYLSADVIRAFYDRSDLYNNTERMQVLQANPDALRSGSLRQYFQEHANPLPINDLNTLSALAKNTVTERGNIEAFITEASLRFNQAAYYGTQKILDADSVTIADLTLWIGRHHTFSADMEVAEVYHYLRDYPALHTHLAGIPARYPMSVEDSEDYNLYLNLIGLFETFENNGLGIGALDPTALAQLLNIAQTNDRYVSRSAQILLEVYYDIVVGAKGGVPVHRADENQTDSELNAVSKTERFDVQPNPAIELVQFTIGSKSQAHQVAMYNLLGQAVRRWEMEAGTDELTAELTGIRPGAYFIVLLSNGQRVSSKLLILK